MKSSTAPTSTSNGVEAWLRSDSLEALKREARACVAAMPMAIFIAALLSGNGQRR